MLRDLKLFCAAAKVQFGKFANLFSKSFCIMQICKFTRFELIGSFYLDKAATQA
jgi:hypothetical protein